MIKTSKSILSAILCFAMVLCLSIGVVLSMPMTAFAEDFPLDYYKTANYYIHLGGYAHMDEIGDGEFAFVGTLPASGVEIQGSIPLNPGFYQFSKNFSWTGDPNVTLFGSPSEGDEVTFVYKVISTTEATLTVTKGKLIYSWDNLNTAIALTPGTLAAPATEATTIKLTGDLTQPADSIKCIHIQMGKNVILDLNGHVLNANGKYNVINIFEYSTLTVIDSTPTTEHKGYIDQNGLWHWDENGEHSLLTGETSKTIKGGILTGGCEEENGGGVSVGTGGTFNMYGGTICGNKKPDEGYNRGAVRVLGTFNMYGGEICSNSLSGVYIYSGISNMYGGTICDNRVSSGGGVAITYNSGSGLIGTFNMLGGTIRGNRVSNGGGGIYNWYDAGKSCKLTLGGTAVVSGNFKGDEANDVQQADAHDCDFNISTDTPPENGMMVGLYSQGIKVKGASEADTKYFFSDSADYYVNFNNNNTPDTSDDYLELKAPADGNKIINIVPSVNGKVTTVPAKEAAENATVTVTVTPDEGYQLKSLKYNDGTTDYDITKDQTSGNYQFTMPAANVTVTAEFEVHTHIGIKQNGQPATETAAGYKDYYKCDCGLYFEEEACTTLIGDDTALTAWKAEGGNGYIAPISIKQNGLSGGAIAGIVIGIIFGLLIIAFVVLYILWKRKNLNVPFLCKVLTPAFRFINKLFFKTKLNDVEAKDAEDRGMDEETYLKALKDKSLMESDK